MERIVICDDDTGSIHELRNRIKEFARKRETDLNIVEYSNGKTLLFDYMGNKLQFNVLYLDADMPNMNGIEVANELRKIGCTSEIVFYTSSKPEVFSAFDVDAFHYVLKGETSIEKQRAVFQRALEKSHEKGDETITFQHMGEHKTIKKKDIKYFTVDLRLITVHYEGNKTFEFYSSMSKVADALQSKGFVRVGKGAIVNMAYVDNRSKAELLMKDGKAFIVGRAYRKLVDKELAYYLKEIDEI
jgi:DNA-binding LytR/AlgR family response regulator